MAEAKLKPPRFAQVDNYFIVTITHTPLARPQEIVLQYLAGHDEVTNAIARELTGINSENTMKEVFYDLRGAGLINRVLGKAGNKSAWKMVETTPADEKSRPIRTAESKRRRQRLQPRRLTRARRKGKKK